MTPLRIGLVGDRDDSITAHRAIPRALQLAADERQCALQASWLPTDQIPDRAALQGFDGLWCVPGSPYRDMDGALRAIRVAREAGVPFLGTCGGFQHAVIEFARHELGWTDADHAESSPEAERAVISLLECGLVEARETLNAVAGSRLAKAYGDAAFSEGYRCRYGLNPRFVTSLLDGGLRVAATGPAGDVRALELADHPFFVATLFQPERAALEGRTPPLVRAFVLALRPALAGALT